MLVPAPKGFVPSLTFDPSSLGRLRVDRHDDADRHVILADPKGDHTLWLHGPEAALRPAVILPLDEAFELRVEVLWRFYRRLRRQPAEPLPRGLDLTPLRRSRLIQLLHILDLHLAGAKPRAIAAALIDADAAALPAIEWKSSSVRKKTQNWISQAEALMNGGYRRLLRGKWLSGEDE